MLKRAISIVLVLVLLPYFTGCTSVKAVNLTDVERAEWKEIYGVVTVDGQQVDFDQPSTDVRNDSIYATVGQNPYAIALDDVQQLRLRRENTLVMAVVIVAVAAVLVVGVVALASSDWDWDWGEPN